MDTMQIKTSVGIRQNYSEFAVLCKSIEEPYIKTVRQS